MKGDKESEALTGIHLINSQVLALHTAVAELKGKLIC